MSRVKQWRSVTCSAGWACASASASMGNLPRVRTCSSLGPLGSAAGAAVTTAAASSDAVPSDTVSIGYLPRVPACTSHAPLDGAGAGAAVIAAAVQSVARAAGSADEGDEGGG